MFTFRQMPVLPSLQLRHRPQAMLKGTETRSPFLMKSTSRPVSITSPVISCPRTRPAGAVVRPRTMCWSEPQMLVETIFRSTPCSMTLPLVGSSSFGKVDRLNLDFAGLDIDNATIGRHGGHLDGLMRLSTRKSFECDGRRSVGGLERGSTPRNVNKRIGQKQGFVERNLFRCLADSDKRNGFRSTYRQA